MFDDFRALSGVRNLDDLAVRQPLREGRRSVGAEPRQRRNPHARDFQAAKTLVAKSRELVGLS